jgi:hypothetical protein
LCSDGISRERRELDALYRDKKVEVYDEFLQKFFAVFHNSEGLNSPPNDMTEFLREFMRKLVLWGGPETISTFINWKEELARGIPNARTIFLTESFLLALRKDLRHTNRGIPKGFLLTLFYEKRACFLPKHSVTQILP